MFEIILENSKLFAINKIHINGGYLLKDNMLADKS